MKKLSNLLNQYRILILAHSLTKEQALKILNLSPNFSEEELNKAYRSLAVKLHPDQNKSPDANEKFIELTSAYELLKNKGSSLNENLLSNENDFYESSLNQNPWKHKYYTPVSEYNDAEKFEYYTNPEIQKEYEQDFMDEQEYAKERYEEDLELLYENQQENASNLAYSLVEQMEEHHWKPELAIAFLSKSEDEILKNLKLLSIDNPLVNNYGKLSKDNKYKKEFFTIKNQLTAAIGRYLSENYPEYLPQYLPFHNNSKDLLDRKSELINKMPISVFKDSFEEYTDIKPLNDEKKIELFSDHQFLEDFCLHIIELTENNERFNLLDVFWTLPSSVLTLIKNKMLIEFKNLGTSEKIQKAILSTIDRFNK